MEKKTTRRIIGVLVVIALVIILLPLMFNGPENQSPIQTSESKAPPFPGTEVEANAATDNASLIPPTQSGALINRIVAPSSLQQPPPDAELAAGNPAPNLAENMADQSLSENNVPENIGMLPSDLSNANLNPPAGAPTPMLKPITDLAANNNAGENVIVIDSDGDGTTTTLTKALAQADLKKSEQVAQPAPVQTPAMLAQAQPSNPTPIEQAVKNVAALIPKNVITSKKTVPTQPVRAQPAATVTPAPKTVAATINKPEALAATIADLKKKAWIVQLGSFRNKLNAERLTNSLRAKGYKAFTLETKSNGQTRVCVGPEFKQIAAASLASKIEQDINMRGIVMTYKPLAL